MKKIEAARTAYRRLRELEPGWVVAAWADGSVTVEAAGFLGHSRPDGGLNEPAATFPTGAPVEFQTIVRHIEAGLWKARGEVAPGRWRRGA